MKQILTLYLLIAFSSLFAQGFKKKPSASAWQKDLQHLAAQLEERHVDLYHTVSKEAFDKAVDDLYHQIPNLSTSEILVQIGQLIAMIGDGHTSFFLTDQRGMRFRLFPIRFWAFQDGIYAIAADAHRSHLIGKRLIQIDQTPVEEAFAKVSTTIGVDNDMEYTYSVPFHFRRPELLHALGISQSADKANFVFEDGTEADLPTFKIKESFSLDWITANGLYKGERPPSMRLEFLFATELILPHLKERKYYWYTYLEEEKALFFQYNVCWDQRNRPTFAEISKELFTFMDENPVERLIVDLRQNTGGEPKIAKPLIDGLVERAKWGQEGRLFVLTGRRTFSAALTNAAQLRSRAGARVVGEPPRGKPNNPSEGRDIRLKRTKTYVTVSTQFVERDAALGDAQYLPVDIEAPYSFKDLQDANDPVLQAALSAKIK